MCATHSSRKFKPNKHFSSLKYVYIQCVYNIWCSILSRVTSTTIRQPWFHCIISDWCFSNAEIDSVVKAAVCVCVVGACVVMTALSMCWMVHSVFAPRRTPCGVASMPVLELRAASGRTTQTNAISLRNGFSHFFFFFNVVTCRLLVTLTNGRRCLCVCPQQWKKSTSVTKCLSLGSMWMLEPACF